jgi:hypothetical protein
MMVMKAIRKRIGLHRTACEIQGARSFHFAVALEVCVRPRVALIGLFESAIAIKSCNFHSSNFPR